jgi:hypothetical protein
VLEINGKSKGMRELFLAKGTVWKLEFTTEETVREAGVNTQQQKKSLGTRNL